MTGKSALQRRKRKKKVGDSREELLAELERIDREDLKLARLEEAYVSTHLWEYFKPFKWQTECGSLFRGNSTTLAASPNGIGKTTLAVVLVMSWMAGYEAWNEVDANYPDAVKKGKKYFKPSSLGMKPPVRGRLTGNDWSHHLGQTVVREIKKWFPLDEFDTKNNTQGVTWFWTHKPTGSTLELMTHDQKIGLYESWRGHFWLPDEPPPQEIYEAFSGRALVEMDGKILIPTTPLSQAWMLDELVLKSNSGVAVMKDLCALDNEITYDNDDEILTNMGLSGVRTKYWRESDGQKKVFFDLIMRRDLYVDVDEDVRSKPDDQGESAERYLIENTDPSTHDQIIKLRFLRKAKNTSLEDKPSRFFGMFKSLVGLVIKEYNRSKHIIRIEEIPSDFPVVFQIDFHLSKPVALAFYMFDKHNRCIVIDEVWENITPEKIADYIIKKKKLEGWNIEYGEIDPLSKGDVKYIKNRGVEIEDAFTVIEDLLYKEDIELGTAAKDPKSGYKNIQKWLKGPNGLPILFFSDKLQSVKDDMYGHVHEIQRLCYDDKGEVTKKNDHFMECLYRCTLMGIEYEEKREPAGEVGANTANSWMG